MRKAIERIERSTADRIGQARYRVLRKAPFFGCLLLRLNIVHADECETMAVDGISLFFNKAFVDNLTDAKLEGLLVHEVLHCALRHFSRRGNRDPLEWNIAADYAINPMVMAAGFELPDGGLIDQQYANMVAEEIYALRQRRKKPPTPQEQEAAKQGQVRDIPRSAPNGEPTDAKETERQWQHATKQATNVARKEAQRRSVQHGGTMAGNMAGGLNELTAVLNRGVVDWRSEVRQFIDQSSTKTANWSRPDRRHVWRGIILPGSVSDRPNHVLIMFDVSGSRDVKACNAGLAEVQQMLDDMIADKVTVVYVDERVLRVDEYEAGEKMRLWSGTGGGTDFRSFMAAVPNFDPSCIICFTDGFVSYADGGQGRDPRVPVLWTITGPKAWADRVTEKAGFGRAVYMY